MPRWILLIIIPSLVLLGALLYAWDRWFSLVAILFMEGLGTIAWLAVAGMMGAAALRWVRVNLEGTLGLASAIAAGLGIYSLLGLALGLLGWLGGISVLFMALAGVVLFVVGLARRPAPLARSNRALDSWLREKVTWWPIWFLIVPAASVAVVGCCMPTMLWPTDPLAYDVLEYHLQVPREWYEAGRIIPLEHNVFSYFPLNVEIHYLMGMHLCGGPWRGMYLAHYLTLGYMAVAVLAVHGVAMELLPPEYRRRGAALAAVTMAAVPWVAMLGSVAYNEAGLLLYGTLAIGWISKAVRCQLPVGSKGTERPPGHWLTTTNSSSWIVAGAMAGLACGTKYTAVPLLLIAAPIVVTICYFRPRTGNRQLITGHSLYLLAALLLFSPWMARNLVWTGNPVFPQAMSLLGQAHFSPQRVERWQAAHRPRDDQQSPSARLSALGTEVILDPRYGAWPIPGTDRLAIPLLWPLALAGLIATWRQREIRFIASMLLALALFWLTLTHLQGRFFILAVPLAALAIAQLARLRHAAWIAGGIALLPILGALHLHNAIHPQLRKVTTLLPFGGEDLAVLSDIIPDPVPPDAPVALIGDARAFLVSDPRPLRYRTVFDVDQRPGQSIVEAWLGPDGPAIAGDHWLVISPVELRRLTTYRHITLPPELWEADNPIVLPPASGR